MFGWQGVGARRALGLRPEEGESREDTKARRSREEGGEIKGNGGGAADKDPDEGALESLGF